MDWKTIFTSVITSIFSSSLITAGIIYLVKKGIDRTIDAHYEKIVEETKLQLKESSRRKAAVFDQQSIALQGLISRIHHFRDLIRTFLSITSLSDTRNIEAQKKEIIKTKKKFSEFEREYKKFMDENRVLFSERIASTQHHVYGLISEAYNIMDLFLKENNKEKLENYYKITERVFFQLGELNERYSDILHYTQEKLGLLEED